MQQRPFDTADVCNYLGSVARGPTNGAIFQRAAENLLQLQFGVETPGTSHRVRGGGEVMVKEEVGEEFQM